MSTPEKYSALIKAEARRLGFSSCGIAKAGFLEEEAPRLERWLYQKRHGTMRYMENHFDKRLDPRRLVDGAQSVVSLLLNYHPKRELPTAKYKIAAYAYGEDYHFVIKRKLKALLRFIRDEIGAVHGRAFVDSAPVLDKAWAVRSGLGWIGKNSNLISKQVGSFFFIAEVILDLELAYDQPVTDHCGSCTRCLDACPTEAIIQPYVVDGSKCISYFTIERKEALPEAMKGKWENWIFGCDICQSVCPWNRFSTPTEEAALQPSEALSAMRDSDWEELTEATFQAVFKGSALKRPGFSGLKRNIRYLKDQFS